MIQTFWIKSWHDLCKMYYRDPASEFIGTDIGLIYGYFYTRYHEPICLEHCNGVYSVVETGHTVTISKHLSLEDVLNKSNVVVRDDKDKK